MDAPSRPAPKRDYSMPVEANQLQQAINELVALSHEGERLRDLREQLSQDVKLARETLAAHKAKGWPKPQALPPVPEQPAADAPAAAHDAYRDAVNRRNDIARANSVKTEAYKKKLAELEKKVATAEARLEDFDKVQFPAFLAKLDAAKEKVEQAKAADTRRSEEKRQADSALQQLDKLASTIQGLIEANERGRKRSGDDSVRFEQIQRKEAPSARPRQDLPTFSARGEMDTSGNLDEATREKVIAMSKKVNESHGTST